MLNTAGHLVGLIPKIVLNELVKQKLFYDSSRLSIAGAKRSDHNGINESEKEDELLDAEAIKRVNL